MKKIIFIFLITYAAYYWHSSHNEPAGSYGEPHNELIMYSLTSCGFCKQKAQALTSENIAFTEYFIDKDKDRLNELNAKLSNAGFKPRSYGTPIFDVRGVMLPNNPDMTLIKARLND